MGCPLAADWQDGRPKGTKRSRKESSGGDPSRAHLANGGQSIGRKFPSGSPFAVANSKPASPSESNNKSANGAAIVRPAEGEWSLNGGGPLRLDWRR